MGKERISRKTAYITLIITVCFTLGIGKINNMLIGNNNYSITATMEPITTLIQIADQTDSEEIEKINKVLDVNYILNNPGETGEKYYWTDGVVKQYTDDEYKDYIKAYVNLAIKYTSVTVNSMWNVFYDSISGQGKDGKQVTHNNFNAIKLYDENSDAGQQWSIVVSKYKEPINLRLRNRIILFLCGVDAEKNISIIHRIFWNGFIPFVIIALSLLYKLIKKDWCMVMLILLIVARIPLVFVTAPAPYFMYYLSTYLCCYVLGFLIIFDFIRNIKEKKC